jgi:hypothetical protein
MPVPARVFEAVPPADLREGHDGLADSIDRTHCIRMLIPEGVSARYLRNEDARTHGEHIEPKRT